MPPTEQPLACPAGRAPLVHLLTFPGQPWVSLELAALIFTACYECQLPCHLDLLTGSLYGRKSKAPNRRHTLRDQRLRQSAKLVIATIETPVHIPESLLNAKGSRPLIMVARRVPKFMPKPSDDTMTIIRHRPRAFQTFATELTEVLLRLQPDLLATA